MEISLRHYGVGDFELLRATMGASQMTVHLGGPESPEKLQQRHERYVKLSDSDSDHMYVILAGTEKEPAGTVGYWVQEHNNQSVWETGWSVLPAFQNQGIATLGTLAVIGLVRADGRHRFLYAFPAVENLASNAVCRKAGFTLEGVSGYEFPKGNPIQCNVRRFDLEE